MELFIDPSQRIGENRLPVNPFPRRGSNETIKHADVLHTPECKRLLFQKGSDTALWLASAADRSTCLIRGAPKRSRNNDFLTSHWFKARYRQRAPNANQDQTAYLAVVSLSWHKCGNSEQKTMANLARNRGHWMEPSKAPQKLEVPGTASSSRYTYDAPGTRGQAM